MPQNLQTIFLAPLQVLVNGNDADPEQIKAGLAWHYKHYQCDKPRRLTSITPRTVRSEKLDLDQSSAAVATDTVGIMSELFGFDAYSPKEIAERVQNIGVAKARLPLLSMVMLGALAGAFIGLGALYFVLVVSDPTLGFAWSRVLGGVVFSLGLLLVVVAGAELFTGNNLQAMAWADGKISTLEVLRNWIIVCVANFMGALGLAVIVFLSGHTDMNGGAVGTTYLNIAAAKVSMPFPTAFFKGVLCNLLVCMAVWMTLAGRSVTDKLVAIVFPISAFVAAGFEHSIANMYIIPLAMMLKASGAALPPGGDAINLAGLFGNLAPVIVGNLVGGSVLVALVYYVIYCRKSVLPRGD